MIENRGVKHLLFQLGSEKVQTKEKEGGKETLDISAH